jgi:tetratricopeptide (TPR) repeat protein
MERSVRTLGAIVIVLLVAGSCAWAIRTQVAEPLRCNSEITTLTANSRLAHKQRDSIRGHMLAEKNLARLRELEQRCSLRTNLYMLIALNEQITGGHDAALAAYDRALSIDPRPEIHFAAGMIHVERGHLDQAVSSFAAAALMSPGTLRRVPGALLEDVLRKANLKLSDGNQEHRRRDGDGMRESRRRDGEEPRRERKTRGRQ